MSLRNPNDLPKVSIIIPCRNEERFIAECLDSIIASEYRRDRLEVLVVDGESDDRTGAIVQGYATEHPEIRLYVDPAPEAPARQNIGISHATGDVIIIMIAHATFAPDYISKCVEAMYEYDVDCAGGSWEILSREDSLTAKAIVIAMSHPFGVGNSPYRTGATSGPVFTDAAAFGCYRKEVFTEFGLFDERLDSSYDFEFNLRLRQTVKGILLVPDAVVYYFARTKMFEFTKRNFSTGHWVTYPLRFGLKLFSARHLVPMAFVLGLLGSAGLALVWPGGLWILSATVVAYLFANLGATAHAFSKQKRFLYLLLLPAIFASMHLSYGLGSLWGLLKVTAHPVSRLFKRSRAGAPV